MPNHWLPTLLLAAFRSPAPTAVEAFSLYSLYWQMLESEALCGPAEPDKEDRIVNSPRIEAARQDQSER